MHYYKRTLDQVRRRVDLEEPHGTRLTCGALAMAGSLLANARRW